MTAKNVRLKDASGNFMYPESKAAIVYNNNNQNLGAVEAGAQVNVLEKIKLNGSELAVVDKTVNVIVPDNAYSAGTGIEIANKVISVADNVAMKSDIPTVLSELTNDSGFITSSALTPYALSEDLATVATSGSYNDLSNKPTIPSEVTESTVSGWGFTKNTGTVTSVNNVSPVNGNVTLSIPTVPTNISAFTNDSGYITLSALTPYATQNWVLQQGYLTEIPAEYITDSELTAKGYQTAADVETAITAKGYTTMSAVEAKGYITNAALVGYATESYVTTAVGTETTARQNADNNLQSQIDAITASSDVTDIVGTYAELQSYDTSALAPNSIIKVLQDESRNNETTYYRWVITGGVGAWSLIGEEGPYYTISAADAKFATQTALSTGLAAKQDTISDLATIRSGAALGATAVQPSDLATVATSGNYNDLSNKPTIPAAQVNSDWNAVSGVAQILNKPTIPTVNNPTITITQGGVTKGSFTLNQASGDTIALDAGGSGSYTAGTGIDITNDVISVTSAISSGASAGSTALQPADVEAFSATEVQTIWENI